MTFPGPLGQGVAELGASPGLSGFRVSAHDHCTLLPGLQALQPLSLQDKPRSSISAFHKVLLTRKHSSEFLATQSHPKLAKPVPGQCPGLTGLCQLVMWGKSLLCGPLFSLFICTTNISELYSMPSTRK